jgi:hypothetical protein
MKVKIEGASDDLIELEGDLSEEFNPNNDEPSYLAFGDGTILKVIYDNDGIWRINRLTKGTAKFTKIEGIVSEDTFDIVELEGDIKWCLFCAEGVFCS